MADEDELPDDLPEPVRRLYAAAERLPGVAEVAVHLQDLAELTPDTYSLPGEFADLPHALLRRTGGGRPGEHMVSVELVFDQTHAGWVAVEFLAWWVRDQSRSDDDIQMRPLALPPRGYGTQLGRTLRFVIERFVVPPADPLTVVDELAESLEDCLDLYAAEIAKPTRLAGDTEEELVAKAELGDAQAMVDLGHFYAPDEDDESGQDAALQALAWFERAAESNHPEGALRAGLIYANGTGVDPDPVKAVAFYRAAADGGLALGMAMLGQCLQHGAGVEQDEAAAAEWYRKGGDAGEPACYAQLGDCYEQGIGVGKDLAKAREYYERALEMGFDDVEEALERVREA